MPAPHFTPVDANDNTLGQVAQLATADAVAAGTIPGTAVMLWNGTTFDRAKGAGGNAATVTQAAIAQYTEAPVVNGPRLTTGNITGAAFSGSASLAFVSVNVTVFTGGTNVVYSLQQQDANGTWVTIGSTSAITATGVYAFSVGPGTANQQMLVAGNGNWRVAWVTTGVFTALTSQIGVTVR